MIDTLLGILGILAAIYVIYNVLGDRKLTGGQKFLWILFALFFSLIAAPVYWLMHRGKSRRRR